MVRELLERADTIRDSTTRTEFVLQAVAVDALEGHGARARRRLDAVGGHPALPDYSALAEAAVLCAEGRTDEARKALQRWERFISSVPATVKVGNEWLAEAVHSRLLGATTMR